MLLQKGRLDVDLNLNAAEWHRELVGRGFIEAPVGGSVAARAGGLPDMHGDPADRIIVATAIDGGHRLITSDRAILDWTHELDRFDARR